MVQLVGQSLADQIVTAAQIDETTRTNAAALNRASAVNPANLQEALAPRNAVQQLQLVTAAASQAPTYASDPKTAAVAAAMRLAAARSSKAPS